MFVQGIGIKKTVDRIQATMFYLEKTGDNLSKRKLPSKALEFLRQAVKFYIVFPESNLWQIEAIEKE